MDGRSLWQKTATVPSFSPLAGDSSAAVAIIGAGLCGVLTAYRLLEAGVTDIAVLEAGKVGGGMTAYTTDVLREPERFTRWIEIARKAIAENWE